MCRLGVGDTLTRPWMRKALSGMGYLCISFAEEVRRVNRCLDGTSRLGAGMRYWLIDSRLSLERRLLVDDITSEVCLMRFFWPGLLNS